MTSLTLDPRDLARAANDDTRSPPAPRKAPRGPVLIGDSICPHAQGTLLLTLWRTWEQPDAG
ncbi:hypothetical protein [Maliponia aquimaris]|uniref:Uncharacterized protein n=1 Tax=Maliponia aquimaris TaxID=1673631 RepID=A0A238KCS2_9RHOB|nr:hypothetical protein [Maliponia aquimaris]SMX40648.1 hypothetical protein MAA8898_02205 [Maliponia aquimaris]